MSNRLAARLMEPGNVRGASERRRGCRTQGLIDPETGCHAVVRKPEKSWDYDALHIYQDSALVFRYASWENDQGGFAMSTAADRVSLHPLRRVSGEPCPGMLPSVGDVR